MNKIMIVGNVLKDVYLNLDGRSEKYVTDEDGVRQLQIGFNASQHHFFRRNSSLGGAAVSLEVLTKLGVSAWISGSSLEFSGDGVNFSEAPGAYRYILVSDEEAAYLTPSSTRISDFIEPEKPVDYIYIDRSVELNDSVTRRIEKYLDGHPKVKLAIFPKASEEIFERKLIMRADLVMCDRRIVDVPEERFILVTENKLSYLNTSEPVNIKRADLSTHLSLYSVGAATILAGFVMGRQPAQCLKLARANMENSKIDMALSLKSLTEIIASYHDHVDDELELMAATLTLGGATIIDVDSEAEINSDSLISGVALGETMLEKFTDDGYSYVDYFTNRRMVPGLHFEKFSLNSNLKPYYEMGIRFVKWGVGFAHTLEESKINALIQKVALATRAKLVPVINISSELSAEDTVSYLGELLRSRVDGFRVAIIMINGKLFLIN
jgi:hypothetical protein